MNHSSKTFGFSADQIPVFQRMSYALRDPLSLYATDGLPSKNAFFDITATLLGYADYQVFRRASKGHTKALDPPVKLTPTLFETFAVKLFKSLRTAFSREQCQWAVAGWFDLDKRQLLDAEDEKLLRLYLLQSAPTPLDDRKRRLIDLGCLQVQTRQFANAPDLGDVVIGYSVTELGRYALARQFERSQEHPLSDLDLVSLGLTTDLSRLRLVTSSVSIRWGEASRVTSS